MVWFTLSSSTNTFGTRDDWWREAAYSVLIRIADFLEDWFFPLKDRTELPLSDAGSWSDDEILRRIWKISAVPDSHGNVWHIDDKTAVKLLSQLEDDIPSAQNHEALAIQLVRQHTRIPVPRLYQKWSHHLEEGMTHLIMDFVKGERLDHAWPKLSWLARARVAWTLRSYVRQLRNIKSELSLVPGPLVPRPLCCEGHMWPIWWRSGPFPDAAALVAHFEAPNVGPRKPRKTAVHNNFHKPQLLVMSHNNLCPDNIILGDDGQVWIVGWGSSGFYPDFCEYTNLMDNTLAARLPLSWSICVPFISNPYRARYLWTY